MDRVIFWVQLLLLILLLQQSDAVADQCSGLDDEIDRLETYITEITGLKHQYEQYYGECKENLIQQSQTLQTTSRKLKESEAVNSYLNTTIDRLTNTVESLNQTAQELREDKKQLQAVIDGQIKREEANSRIVQELRENQKQLRSPIDDLTKTVEAMNQMVQVLYCGKPEDACRDLINAVKYRDVNKAKRWVNCTNESCTDNDERLNTPLTHAANIGSLELSRVLLEGGANIERARYKERTALHVAAWNGYPDVCRLLLDWGANVEPLDAWKDTPLHDAAHKGHLSVVKLLVERGADLSLKNDGGKTASVEAQSTGHKDVADWLNLVSRV